MSVLHSLGHKLTVRVTELAATPGVDDRVGLTDELCGPGFRRLVAFVVARGAEHPGDQAVASLPIDQSLKTVGQAV